MERRLSHFWVLAMLLMWFTSNSQSYVIANSALNVGNPGGLRTASDFTTTGGTSILNGGSGSTTVNYWSAATAIPFSFNFYGSPVTHFIVSKNGLLTFDTTNAGQPVGAALNVNTSLPNAALPNNTVAFFWEDTSSTSISTADHVYTYTYGTAPNRQFWVHYYSFEVGTQSYCYWAMVMEETTDNIYVVDMGYAASPSTYTGTVGVQVNSTTAYEVTTPLNGSMGSPNVSMGSGGTGAVDNEYYTFQYFPAGACFPPSGLGAYNITSSSADFYWTAGSASNWQIQIDSAGFTVGNGTWMNSTNDTISFTGLMSNAVYEVYVRDSCGVNDVSQWSGPYAFQTLCSAVSSFPWIEDFETSGNSIPDCWENETGDDADWIFRTGNIGHGSTTDHTLGTSSGHYAAVDDSHSSTTDTVNNLLTPSFDLTSLTMPRLNFYYFIGNDATLTSTLYIDIYDGSVWQLGVDTVSYSQEAWLRHLLDLTPYKSTATRIRFRVHETTDFNSDLSIDDVIVEETPNCPKSQLLGAYNITATAADLFWTTGGATSWVLAYDTAGFTPGTGNSMVVTNDTVSITGLTPITNYDFYVKDICAPGDSSTWSGPYSFTSGCAPFIAPYTESFDGTATPVCWSQSATSGGPWVFGGSGFNSVQCAAASDHTGNSGNFAWMDQSSTDVGVSLEMGDVDVTALTTPYLEFYYWMCGTGYSPVNLTYIEAWNGTTWLLVDSIAQATSGWEKFGFDVSSFTYGTNMLKLRFRAESGGNTSDFYGDNAIDDVSIIEAPSCFTPSGLGVVGVSDMSATVYWTTGGAANWNIEYGPTGYTQGAGTMMAAANDTTTIGSLMAGTSYDVYVRDSCGLADVSAWIGPITFVTSPCDTAATCTHSVILSDDWGDGWNGSEVTVYQGGVPVAVLGGAGFTSTMGSPAGDTLTTSLSLCDSVDAYFVITTGSTGSPYYSSEIGLEVISPYGVSLVFYDNSATATQGDTIVMLTPSCAQPSCLPPSNLGAFNVGANSAEIYWTSTSNTFGSTVEYGPIGFTPGTGTLIAATNDTIMISGLSALSNYTFCVTDSCGVGNTSTTCANFTTTLPSSNCNPFASNASNDSLCVPGFTAFTTTSGSYLGLLDGSGNILQASDTLSFFTSADTTVSVTEIVPNSMVSGHVGPLTSIATSGYGNFSNGQWISVLDTIRIDSMTVNANGAVTAQLVINNATNTTVLQRGKTFTTGTATGDYQVEVGVVLTPGTYFMNVSFISGAGQLFRATSGASYPYVLSGLMSIDSTNFSSQSRIYYTFDMVATKVCLGTPASATAYIVGQPAGEDATVVLCDNGGSEDLSSYLSASAAAGGTFSSTTAGAALSGSMFNPALVSSGTYEVLYITSSLGGCPADTAQLSVLVQNCSGCATLAPPVPVNDTLCGPGLATLTATGSNLIWYNPMDSVLIGGNTFSDTVSATTSYSVRSVFSAGPGITLGPSVTTNANAYPTGNFTNGQYITVSQTVRIDSATFAVNGALDFVVAIQDAQKTDTLQISQVISFSGADTAAKEIGVVLSPGTYFINTIPLSGNGVLFRMTAGAAFPYGVPGYFTADSSDFGPSRYYYLHDMKVSSACFSPAVPALAVVTTGTLNAGMSASDSICDSAAVIDLTTYLGTGVTAGGVWIDVNNSGALSGNLFDPSGVAAGQTYVLRYLVSNSCGSDSADVSLYIKDCTVGLQDYFDSKLEIYPNPTDDFITISLAGNSLTDVSIQLYDVSGKLILMETAHGQKDVVLDLKQLPKGIYTVKVSSNQISSARHITKY